jgi:hypothetical protein
MCDIVPSRRRASGAKSLLFALCCLVAAFPALGGGSNDVVDHNGQVMRLSRVVLIFWLPNGVTYDPIAPDGIGHYKILIQQFLNDVSATSYYDILTQYPGNCGLKAPAFPACHQSVLVAGAFSDAQAYPHAGSAADPLQDADIQAEIKKIIGQHSIKPDLDTAFLVFTGNGIKECKPDGTCTGTDFCAYHGSFTFNGQPVVYGFMPVASALKHCDHGVSKSPNNQIVTDREIFVMSHELFEMVSDPFLHSWFDDVTGDEIGDKCNELSGPVEPDGANLLVKGRRYIVQPQWSNGDGACATAFAAISGPTIEFLTLTGADDLRGDSSATAALDALGAQTQSVTLKTQDQPSWDNGTKHVRVFALNILQFHGIGSVGLGLQSHPSGGEGPDNWNLDMLDVKVRDGAGNVTCEQQQRDIPLVRLSESAGTYVFPTPNCPPRVKPSTLFDHVSIAITTGGDDLRDDSEATFALTINGPALNFELKGQNEPHWDNFSAHQKVFAISPPQSLNAIQNVIITLTSHDNGGENDDNWNVQSVGATLFNAKNEQTCLLNSIGNPLFRLTGAVPAGTLQKRAGC